MTEYEDADEYCPHCDNHYVIEAKTPQTEGKMIIEFQTQKGHENKVFKDDREKQKTAVLDYNGFSSDDEEAVSMLMWSIAGCLFEEYSNFYSKYSN